MSSTQNAIVQFQTDKVRASITRPANTTAYTAGDVISNADDSHMEFAEAANKGAKRRTGSIAMARVISSANVGTKADLELWLFSSSVTAMTDNAAFTPTDAEMATLVGVIPFGTSSWRAGHAGAGAAGNAVCEATNQGIVFELPSTSIYGVLVVRNAYVPVSGEIFTVDLLITKD